MGRPVSWTPEQDRQLRDLRAAGLIWSEIGARMGRDGACCRLRITKVLGEPDPLRKPETPPAPVRPPLPTSRARNDGPLLPGDPRSWSVLIAGTVLDGSAFR